MRITTGIFRSRLIKYPRHIRPTQDKIRKSILDIISQRVAGSKFLELFAGSGAVGIEAVSNAAEEVVFVDSDIKCCKIIESNLRDLGLISKEGSIDILARDAFKAIELLQKAGKKFDIVFLDPPYYPECGYSRQRHFGIPKKHRSSCFNRDQDLAKKTLQKIAACDILAPHALVVVEHHKKDIITESFVNITCFKQKRYGDKLLSFYERSKQ